MSMAVPSDGSYGIKDTDLIYSFPVKINAKHEFEIVKGLDIDDFSREKMDLTMNELLQEKNDALAACEN